MKRDLEPARGRKRGEIGHDRGDGDGEQTSAQVIDPGGAVGALLVQISPEPGRGERPNRQVHPEDPGPGEMLDDEAAGQWSEHRRQRPDACQPALNLGPLVGGIEVADDGHRGRLDRARADALNEPEGDQRRHRPREPAQDRANEEDRDPDQHHRLAADAIGELAEHHGGCGLGQEEGREHPAIEGQAAELADDLRHGGRDDRRFDRDHEIRRHHGGEHERSVSGKGVHRNSWEVASVFKAEGATAPIAFA